MIKQIIVVRTDLNMRRGKSEAQAAHAAMMFMTRTAEYDFTPAGGEMTVLLSPEEFEWLRGSFAKISVAADSEEHLKQICARAREAGLTVYECVDNGTTEFGGIATLTCAAIGPHDAEKLDPITRELKLR